MIRRVAPGDRLRISAGAYNALVDIVNGQSVGLAGNPILAGQNPSMVLVRNDSGGDMVQFSAIGLDSPIIATADNEPEFRQRVALSGSMPGVEHAGRFGILADPLAAGAIGRAFVAGLCVARVALGRDTHRHAEVWDGFDVLRSTQTGSARIMWAQPEGEWQDGVGLCVVQIGCPTQQRFWALINGNAALDDNRWKYGWDEAEWLADGTCVAVENGLSGTTSSDYAINGFELPNSAAGLQGCGVDISGSDFPPGFAIIPIVDGVAVELSCVFDDNGDRRYVFSAPNGVDGTCEA